MSKAKHVKRARRAQRLDAEAFNAARPIGVATKPRIDFGPLARMPVNQQSQQDAATHESGLDFTQPGIHKLVDKIVAETSQKIDSDMIAVIRRLIEASIEFRTDPQHWLVKELTDVYMKLYDMGAVGAANVNPMEFKDWGVFAPAYGGLGWNELYPKFWNRQYQRLRHALNLPLSSDVPCTYMATSLMVTLNSHSRTTVTFTVRQYHDLRPVTVSYLIHSK